MGSEALGPQYTPKIAHKTDPYGNQIKSWFTVTSYSHLVTTKGVAHQLGKTQLGHAVIKLGPCPNAS